MPDVEAQSIYRELKRRGVFDRDPEAQAVANELRRRGVIEEPSVRRLRASPAPTTTPTRGGVYPKGAPPGLSLSQRPVESLYAPEPRTPSVIERGMAAVSEGLSVPSGVVKATALPALTAIRKRIAEAGFGDGRSQSDIEAQEKAASLPFAQRVTQLKGQDWRTLGMTPETQMRQAWRDRAGQPIGSQVAGATGSFLGNLATDPLTWLMGGGGALGEKITSRVAASRGEAAGARAAKVATGVNRAVAGGFTAQQLTTGIPLVEEGIRERDPIKITEGVLSTAMGTLGGAHLVKSRGATARTAIPDVPPKPIITERFKAAQKAKRVPNAAARPGGETVTPPSEATSAAVAPNRVYHSSTRATPPTVNTTESAARIVGEPDGIFYADTPELAHQATGRRRPDGQPNYIHEAEPPKNPLRTTHTGLDERAGQIAREIYKREGVPDDAIPEYTEEMFSNPVVQREVSRRLTEELRAQGYDGVVFDTPGNDRFTIRFDAPEPAKPVIHKKGVRELSDAEKRTQEVADRVVANTPKRAEVPKPVSQPSPLTRDVMQPEDIGVLEGMQYKKQGITDAKNAVGDSLKGTDVYDVDQGGTLTVWEDKSGRRWAVNGHHRAELAKRADKFVKMGPEGAVEAPREVPVTVLRESDGWTMAKARARGALENIRDGKGTAIDALDVMQELSIRTPEQYKSVGVSLTSDIARNLAGLQSLDEQSLFRVKMGDVPEHVAAGVGSVEGLTPEAQRGAIDEANRTGLGTYQKARRLAEHYLDDQRSGHLAQEAANDLFGGEFSTASSTRGIRVELEDAAKRLLKARRSDLLKPTEAVLREGEVIDAPARKSEAQGMAESQKALDERLDLLYRQESVKQAVADLAAQVGHGTLDKQTAGRQLAALLEPHTGRSVRELADARGVQLDSGAGGVGAVQSRDTQPVPDGAGQGLFPEEASKNVASHQAQMSRAAQEHFAQHTLIAEGKSGAQVYETKEGQYLFRDGDGNLTTTTKPVAMKKFKQAESAWAQYQEFRNAPKQTAPIPQGVQRTLTLSDAQAGMVQDVLGYEHPLSQRIESAFADGQHDKATIPFTDAELIQMREAVEKATPNAKEFGVSMAGVKKQLTPKPVSPQQTQAKLPSGKKSKPGAFQFGAKPGSPADKVGQAVQQAVQKLRPTAQQKAAVTKIKDPNETGLGNLVRSTVRSPLTIKNVFGEDISLPGAFETKAARSGVPEAKLAAQKVNDSALTADRTITERVHATQKAVDEIEALLKKQVGGKLSPKDKQNFIGWIERDRTDPARQGLTGKLKEALDKHDALTEEWRQYIIKTRNEAGIDTPDDWGINTTGYLRHLFLGDIELYQIGANGQKTLVMSDRNGQQNRFFLSYAEAQGKVNQILKADPNATFTMKAKNITAGDPTTRLSNGQFFRTVGKIKENVSNAHGVDLSNAEIMSDLRGLVGRRAAKSKFNPVTLMRKGYAGFDLDYGKVMRIAGAQVARAQELTLLNRRVQPEVEKLNKLGLHGLAEEMQGHLADLWGTPTALEKVAGVVTMRTLARRIASVHNALKLNYNVGASAANSLDTLASLWPRVSSKEFAALYADYAKPATRARLREAGVLAGASKLDDSGQLARVAEGGAHRFNLFQKASDVNRSIGYLYGEKEAIGRGLDPKNPADAAKIHENGMAWAGVVEYASNKFHRAPILRGPVGTILLQYKGYGFKQREMELNFLREQTGDVKLKIGTRNINTTRPKRLAKYAAAKTVIGGAKALGVLGHPATLALAAGLTYFGMPKKEAEKWAAYGVLGQIGVDMSHKIGTLEAPYGETVAEQAFNLVGGPTGGAFGTLVDTARSKKKDWRTATERIAPLAKSARTLGEMATRGGRATEKVGGRNWTLTPMESLGQAMGFPLVRKSQAYDQINARR